MGMLSNTMPTLTKHGQNQVCGHNKQNGTEHLEIFEPNRTMGMLSNTMPTLTKHGQNQVCGHNKQNGKEHFEIFELNRTVGLLSSGNSIRGTIKVTITKIHEHKVGTIDKHCSSARLCSTYSQVKLLQCYHFVKDAVLCKEAASN